MFTPLQAELLRQVFLPPDATAVPRTLASLGQLTYDPDTEEPSPLLVRITRATLLADGRIHLTADPPPQHTRRLAYHDTIQSLTPDRQGATTTGPLAGPLVHFLNSTGTVMSNHVVVDDPDALDRVLQVGERTSSARPPELTIADRNTPLGQALLYLHRNVVMDVAERAGSVAGGDVTREEASGNDGDDDLWNRLEREKLGRDPRAGTYARLLGQRLGDGDGTAEP